MPMKLTIKIEAQEDYNPIARADIALEVKDVSPAMLREVAIMLATDVGQQLINRADAAPEAAA